MPNFKRKILIYIIILLLMPSSIIYASEDVKMISQTLYGESRGIEKEDGVLDKKHQAAVVWCILNRVDAGHGTIKQVITAENQFVGYKNSHPVWPELEEIANDVIARWEQEKNNEIDVGRVLPKEYLWFTGYNGYNWFRKEYKTNTYWDWSLPDPYVE